MGIWVLTLDFLIHQLSLESMRAGGQINCVERGTLLYLSHPALEGKGLGLVGLLLLLPATPLVDKL